MEAEGERPALQATVLHAMTATRAGRPGGLSARLALALASSALVLVLLEAGSHLVGSFEGPLQPLRVGHIQMYGRHDPLLFWSLRPHARAPDGGRWINSDGLRGPEVGPKQAGEVRILSLGESTTFAAKMAYDQTYSAVLEQGLNDGSRETHVRVLNAGVPGYTLFQGVQFLLHRSLPFEPDLVLLYFGYNDFLPVAFLAERAGDATGGKGGLNDWELFDRRQQLPRRFVSFLIQNSNLARGLLQLRRREPADLAVNPYRPRVPAEHRRKLLELARQFCEDHGIELVVVIPIYRSFPEHAALLRSFTQTSGVLAVDLPRDLPPRFERHRETYFSDDAHPTPEGHRLIAGAIHEVVSPRIE
jgi:lysophospholipase L1-like esterase